MEERITEILEKSFKPEFLNRLDEIIIFHSLSEKQIRKIVDLQLLNVNTRLGKKNIKIEFSDKLKDYLSKKGFDPVYGARPLKRLIQNQVLDELALKIIEGKIKQDKKFQIDIVKDKIVIK